MVIIVFGASGAGKTTVGRKLAERLGWLFIEGDAYHPARNVERMKSGHALTDADRAPWLAELARVVSGHVRTGSSIVLACSALKRAYRAALVPAGKEQNVRFVYLEASPDVLAERLARRKDHFFPPALLQSQLRDLEPPAMDEHAISVDASLPPERIVETVCARLGLHPGSE